MTKLTLSLPIIVMISTGCIGSESYPTVGASEDANATLSLTGASVVQTSLFLIGEPRSRWFFVDPTVAVSRDGEMVDIVLLAMEPLEVTLDESGGAEVMLDIDPSSDLDHVCELDWDEASLSLLLSSTRPRESYSGAVYWFDLSVTCSP